MVMHKNMNNDKHTHWQVKEIVELIRFLGKKQYTLSDVGLKDKQAFDWTKGGLFLEERTTKVRRKYNAIEYVWLRIIKELREFGLSFKAIRGIKSYLLQSIDLAQMIIDMLEDDNPQDPVQVNKLTEGLLEAYHTTSTDKTQTLNLESDKDKVSLVGTVLCMLIFGVILEKINYHLLITKEGKVLITDGEPFDDKVNLSDLLNAPYISFPLRHIVIDFIAKEELMSFDKKSELLSLTSREEKVLTLLRQGNLSSLSVRFDKNNEIKLIETEEEIDLEKAQGRLADFIMRNSYQEIVYKTQNGKITTMKRKTKHK